ncbi:hypothetical protein HZA33_00230 [Candidatus Pacearchaeota archaeon]|nr:hypothetical protein [Candidatus Pacearchaeota archaeon]
MTKENKKLELLDKLEDVIRESIGDSILTGNHLVDISDLSILGTERFEELFQKYLQNPLNKKESAASDVDSQKAEEITRIFSSVSPDFIERVVVEMKPDEKDPSVHRCGCTYHARQREYENSTGIDSALIADVRGWKYKNVEIDSDYENPYKRENKGNLILSASFGRGEKLSVPIFAIEDFFSQSGLVYRHKEDKDQTNVTKKISALERTINNFSQLNDLLKKLKEIASKYKLIPLVSIGENSSWASYDRKQLRKFAVELGLSITPASDEQVANFAKGIVEFFDYTQEKQENSGFRYNCDNTSEEKLESQMAARGIEKIKMTKPFFEQYRNLFSDYLNTEVVF